MATNRQGREAERRREARKREAMRQRRARRNRLSVIAGAIVTVAVIIVVVVVVVANRGGDDSTPAAGAGAAKTPAAGASAAQSAPAAQCGAEQFAAKQVRAAKGATVSFDGVKITGAKDLGGKPGVTAKAAASPKKLLYKDLVVGKGQAADPTSCVTVQYDGVLYKSGKEFDSSWSRGMLAQFPLTGVVPGFTQGIGGTTGVPPMKVGGRRVIVVPPALGYGAQGSPPTIPASAPLVFVIDLTKVTSG